jgi:hypothetical protein
MSLKKDKSVPELVEKYRRQYPTYERPELRAFIRTMNPDLFQGKPSNLKKLDRYLRKEFKIHPQGKFVEVRPEDGEILMKLFRDLKKNKIDLKVPAEDDYAYRMIGWEKK